MIENNVKKIIFSSTAAVYGVPEYLPLDEKHPLKPINHYGYTKLQTEKLSIFTVMRGKLAMLTLGTSMLLVIISAAKYVQKNETLRILYRL